jgi:GNAT superfamily N-acetyltransferase
MILVAENGDGEIAGYCAVHWVPFLFLSGGEAYITELFVRPADSGKRIGTSLLDQVIAEARRRGCARVSLLNGRDSEAYRRNFYAQRGWIERDRLANFVFPLSNSQKRVSMLTSSSARRE